MSFSQRKEAPKENPLNLHATHTSSLCVWNRRQRPWRDVPWWYSQGAESQETWWRKCVCRTWCRWAPGSTSHSTPQSHSCGSGTGRLLSLLKPSARELTILVTSLTRWKSKAGLALWSRVGCQAVRPAQPLINVDSPSWSSDICHC